MSEKQKSVVEKRKELCQLERNLETKKQETIQYHRHVESIKKDLANISKSIEKSNAELSSKIDLLKEVSEPSSELMTVKKDHEDICHALGKIKETIQSKKIHIENGLHKLKDHKVCIYGFCFNELFRF